MRPNGLDQGVDFTAMGQSFRSLANSMEKLSRTARGQNTMLAENMKAMGEKLSTVSEFSKYNQYTSWYGKEPNAEWPPGYYPEKVYQGTNKLPSILWGPAQTVVKEEPYVNQSMLDDLDPIAWLTREIDETCALAHLS